LRTCFESLFYNCARYRKQYFLSKFLVAAQSESRRQKPHFNGKVEQDHRLAAINAAFTTDIAQAKDRHQGIRRRAALGKYFSHDQLLKLHGLGSLFWFTVQLEKHAGDAASPGSPPP
jgi:hypothetical protein